MKIYASFLLGTVYLVDIKQHGATAKQATLLRRRLQGVTTSDLAAANTADNCWIQIDNTAYDVTAYAPNHPGTAAKIVAQCGKDVTQKFYAQLAHSASLLAVLPGIVNKGIVVAAPPTNAPVADPTSSPTNAPVPAPTNAPVPAPTNAPVPAPTNAPVPAPTNAPVPAPTNAPIADLTNAPIADAPVIDPTDAPIAARTNAPVVDPTNAPVSTPAPVQLEGVVTPSELAAANTADNCWIQIDNTAYDVTAYAPNHPGTAAKIVAQCGKDVTQKFYAQLAHSASLLATLPGIVNKGVVTAAPAPTSIQVPAPTPIQSPAPNTPAPAPVVKTIMPVPVPAPTSVPVLKTIMPVPVPAPTSVPVLKTMSPVPPPTKVPVDATTTSTTTSTTTTTSTIMTGDDDDDDDDDEDSKSRGGKRRKRRKRRKRGGRTSFWN